MSPPEPEVEAVKKEQPRPDPPSGEKVSILLPDGTTRTGQAGKDQGTIWDMLADTN